MELNGTTKINNFNLFKQIYKTPDKLSSQQRLALRSKHLHDLAAEIKKNIENDTSIEFLCVYVWAIEYISIEINLLSNKFKSQG